MKFVAPADRIGAALQLGTALRTPKGSPAAHLRVTEDGATIQCSDVLAIGRISTRLNAVAQAPGEIAVAVDRLLGIVSSFRPGDNVTIETDKAGARIVCGHSLSRLPGIPIDTLPASLAIEEEVGKVETSGTDFLRLLDPIAAASHEETRYYLNGILLHTVDGRLISVGTDGLRLIRASVPAGAFSTDYTCIVPAPTVIALRKLLAQTKPARILLRKSKRLIEFSAKDFSFVSRLTDAVYPNYQRIIPVPAPNMVTCSRSELLAALARLGAAATVQTRLAALQWADGAEQLSLSLAREPDSGSDAISAETKGSARFVVPISQFVFMLREFNCGRIGIETADRQPIVLRGDGEKVGMIAPTRFGAAHGGSESRHEE